MPSRKKVQSRGTVDSKLASVKVNKKPVSNPPHLIVIARAGTGKTTTLIEGLKLLKGDVPSITPSPQQQDIWEQMLLSKDVSTICFVAFNKPIATELQQRVPLGCDAMTMHSMGYKAVQKALGRQEPNSFVVSDIIAEILETDIRQLRKVPEKLIVVSATEKLVSLCKQNLSETDPDSLWSLACHYDIDLNGSRDEVFALVPQVIERCKSPQGRISFDDMIWLPVVLNLPVFQYDLLLVDEAQDLNRAQQALARKAGRRLILCGDPRQAIYGFAGADSESMSRMERELAEDYIPGPSNDARIPHVLRGVITLPLTVTRRCGKAIVERAKQQVPDFEAHESNGEGLISYARYEQKTVIEGNYASHAGVTLKDGSPDYASQVQDGDMVLCRVNAPLVSQCFRFLKAGRKAVIQGRDVGAGLTSTVKKLARDNVSLPVVQLVERLSDWHHKEVEKEQAKRNPSEARLISLQDRYECLLCFTEGEDDVSGVLRRIDSVFTDDKTVRGIRLSSIHKAKGLESRRVFFLMPEGAGCPHPMAKTPWQQEQEQNLLYVGITRAIEELVFVR